MHNIITWSDALRPNSQYSQDAGTSPANRLFFINSSFTNNHFLIGRTVSFIIAILKNAVKALVCGVEVVVGLYCALAGRILGHKRAKRRNQGENAVKKDKIVFFSV